MTKAIMAAAAPQFARPGDTTAYAAFDLIANSTTAASVVPLRFDFKTTSRFLQIDRALFRKSSTGTTNPNFRLNLFSAAPTIATNGDNSIMSGNTTGATTFIGCLQLAGTVTPMVDGCVGNMIPSSHTSLMPHPLLIDAQALLGGGDTVTLYGLLEALAAYAPGNAETFNVTLFARPLD